MFKLNKVGAGTSVPVVTAIAICSFLTGCPDQEQSCDREIMRTPDGREVIVCDDRRGRGGVATSGTIFSSSSNTYHPSQIPLAGPPPAPEPKPTPAPTAKPAPTSAPKTGFFSSWRSGSASSSSSSSGG